MGPLRPGDDAGDDADSAVERRWSRRQYEKTVDGGIVASDQTRTAPVDSLVAVHVKYDSIVLLVFAYSH